MTRPLMAIVAGVALLLSAPLEARAKPSASAVIVNGEKLSRAQVQRLEARVGMRIAPGDYWYDRVSGAWGVEGQPQAGITLPGLEIGGPLRADASRGTSGVFINGRQLHWLDVQRLQQFLNLPVQQGRYWVDAQGNFGYERGPVIGNLIMLARANNPRLAQQGNTLTECDGAGCGSGNGNTGIGVITDGSGGAAVFSGGKVYTTP